jgi:uncharacterized repeat protein (TIGR01451 family)
MSTIITLLRLLPLLLLLNCYSGSVHAQQGGGAPSLALGDAVVTGFSGTLAPDPAKPRPASKSAVDLTFINPDGPSARVIAVGHPGFVWDGRLLAAPKTFDVFARDVGQVFGVALDDDEVPNIYLAATSAFGLNIVARGRDGLPERRKKGGPGAGWMKGQFGLDLQGGPGSIYKVDGRTGAVSLLTNLTLEGVPNPGPGLGNLVYDSAHRQLFVSDLHTGMIHRIDRDGKDLGSFDHGVAGLAAAGLPPVPFNSKSRPNIASDRFDSETPATWGFAPPPRQVWGLALHDGRLYYAVAAGPQIWSVGIRQDGGFAAADARWELDIPAQSGPLPVSDIAFSEKGAMIVAQRALIAGSYDYSAFTRPGEPRVMRFWPKAANEAQSPGRWTPAAEEYAVGFAGNYRNTNGGVALGYGYGQDGVLSTDACEVSLWTTAQNMRNAIQLRSQLDPGGPLVVHGIHGVPAGPVRGFNEPPWMSYSVDYDDRFDDPSATGHLGGVRIYTKPCPAAAYGGPGYAANAPSTSGPGITITPPLCTPTCVCPPGTVQRDGTCVSTTDCPPTMVPGAVPGTCVCPPHTVLQNNKCVAVIFMCPPPMVDNGNACGCPEGTVRQGRECVPVTNCSLPGQLPGNCACPTGTVAQGNRCVPQACPAPMVAGPCTCPTSTVQDGGVCVTPPNACPPPLVPGPVLGTCICPPGSVLNDDKECVPAKPVDIGIDKTGGTTPVQEPFYSFTLTISNNGASFNGSGAITVTDVLPAGMTFNSVSVTPAGDWSCPPSVPAGGTLTCTYVGSGPTGTGVIGTISINATASGPAPYPPITNCTSVGISPASGNTDTNPANDSSCVTVTKPVICPPPTVPGPTPGTCVCPANTVPKGSACVPVTTCQLPLVPGPTPGTCLCPANTVQKGSECVPVTTCKPPLVPGPAPGTCVCPGATVSRGSRCIEPVVCRAPAKLNRNGTGCTCPGNLVPKGNTCVEPERKPKTPDRIPEIRLPGLGFPGAGPHGGDHGGNSPGGGGGLPGRR